MGRSKQKMELIKNEKLRRKTFQRRMKGFKKQIHEFSTLCDVKAYSVIFGPKQGSDPKGLVEPETWPENKNDVYDFFKEFQNHKEEKKETGIAEFFMNQTKKVRAELNRLREQNDKATAYMYTPTLIPVANFHQNSSLLPTLDDYETMFNDSSQDVSGYCMAVDPESYAMDPLQLYYQYHHQQQQQQLNEF